MSIIDKKQKLMIEYMIADNTVFAKCYRVLKPSYFDQPLDLVVECILGYFKKHKQPPSIDVIEAETEVLLKERILEDKDISYTLEEIEEHCQIEAAKEAVLKSADMINEGMSRDIMSVMREAMLVKIDRHVGISIFDNTEQRIIDDGETNVLFSTGILSIDNMIGKIRKPDFGMVYAVSSGGKSLMLANIAIGLARQDLNVHIITLELKEGLYARRIDSMITDFDISHHTQVAAEIDGFYKDHRDEFGDITLKKMIAGTTANDIEAHLLDYSLEKGYYPDAVIVDYIGLMGVDGIKSNNKFDTDHEKSIGLIRLGEMHDMIMISAGQINRDGYDVLKVTPSHCAGGISIVNNSDWSIALVANEEDIDNDQVQAVALKIRHTAKQSGSRILYKNPKTLKFSDSPNADQVRATPSKRLAKIINKNEANKKQENVVLESEKTDNITNRKAITRVRNAMDLISRNK